MSQRAEGTMRLTNKTILMDASGVCRDEATGSYLLMVAGVGIASFSSVDDALDLARRINEALHSRLRPLSKALW
jgi:hypothetical protein